jgi:hypothetical protein
MRPEFGPEATCFGKSIKRHDRRVVPSAVPAGTVANVHILATYASFVRQCAAMDLTPRRRGESPPVRHYPTRGPERAFPDSLGRAGRIARGKASRDATRGSRDVRRGPPPSCYARGRTMAGACDGPRTPHARGGDSRVVRGRTDGRISLRVRRLADGAFADETHPRGVWQAVLTRGDVARARRLAESSEPADGPRRSVARRGAFVAGTSCRTAVMPRRGCPRCAARNRDAVHPCRVGLAFPGKGESRPTSRVNC